MFYLPLWTNIGVNFCHLHSKGISPCCLLGVGATVDHWALVLTRANHWTI